MAKMLTRSLMCAVLGMSPVALAQDATPGAEPTTTVRAPDADAVRDTWNYFYNGKGQGPVLVDAKVCTEVAKEGPNKFECIGEVGPEGIKANTTVMLWHAYLVPQGDSVDDLMVQSKQGAVVRETKDVKLKGEGWRVRQWTGLRMSKPGNWTVSVLRGDQVLKEIQVKVL